MSKESVTFLTEEEQQELKSKFLGFRQGLVGVGPSRHLLPPHCMGFTKKYKDFKFCESDVVIATFPRSGTTWTQEIVWTMRNGLDFNEASKVSLNVRSPSLSLIQYMQCTGTSAQTLSPSFCLATRIGIPEPGVYS
ncbi:hypothetical protein O3P69_011030 [Scylla paramamosain]|uniref:Sulfotransferase domain-containing protein n=1 Tax=Scylla paramamosain TaxID=85552 RepID=A0AAW0SEL8_SCYPA